MEKKSVSNIDMFGKTLPELSQIEALTLTVNSAEFARARFHVEIEEYAEKNNKDSNLRCGIAYCICGKYEKAIAELEQASDDGYKFFFYGKTLKSLGQYSKAVEMFRKAALELKDPTIAELERIGSLIYAKRFEEANSSLTTLSKVLSGKSAEYHYLLGKFNEGMGEYDIAMENFEKAISIDEHHVESMFAMAYMLDLHGNDNLALEYYKATTQINPLHVSALLNMAVIYEDNEDYDNAMNCINIVLKHHPNHKRGRLFKKDVQSAMTMFVDEEQEKKKHSRSRVLEKPITDYELSVRSRNCLKKMNINTVGDLLKINESELLSYKNFGETSLTEIRSILEAEGLRLGMYHDEFLANESQNSELSEEENAMMRKPISELELSVRARRAIDKLGIRTLGDIVNKTEAELLACKNFGITSLTEIKERLCKFNLKLRKID
ncbi:MAG: DNA-directed RNA polymerase subunit alpha C-terminal domain-containing protein [Sedimentisphaeraceae bacterium JB056]